MSRRLGAIRADPIDSAHDGGLRYIRGETGPGIVRRKRGRGFVYLQPTARASGTKPR